jgi:hypothetical protein
MVPEGVVPGEMIGGDRSRVRVVLIEPADLAKNKGMPEEYNALRRARRERHGTNVRLIKPERACWTGIM